MTTYINITTAQAEEFAASLGPKDAKTITDLAFAVEQSKMEGAYAYARVEAFPGIMERVRIHKGGF